MKTHATIVAGLAALIFRMDLRVPEGPVAAQMRGGQECEVANG